MPLYRYNPRHLREPATTVLLALNLLIALVDGFSGEMLSRAMWSRGFDVYYGDWWRPLTAGFAHSSLIHIGMNAYSLWVLGKIVEPLYGTRQFLAIYFLALLGGSALALAFYDPNTPSLGASGAIFGLFGAMLGYLYSRTGSWQGVMSTPWGRQLLIVLGINVYISLMPGISLLGHLGGFVPGLILGICFERAARRDDSFVDRLTAWLTLVAVGGLLAYAAVPWHQPGYIATRALKAFESGDRDLGLELLNRAEAENTARHPGVGLMIRHLSAWERGRRHAPEAFDYDTLRWPLTHIKLDWPSTIPPEGREHPFHFLRQGDDS
ncbi:MAG: hypothetical protein BroJett014_22520 [Planctomycetota bacterium]|nr:hypothetical protein [Planctomycetota bacterium]GIK53279.1 MAG: hypothetical protein BroJett014_22520 [Planctomycetota bacterium]